MHIRVLYLEKPVWQGHFLLLILSGWLVVRLVSSKFKPAREECGILRSCVEQTNKQCSVRTLTDKAALGTSPHDLMITAVASVRSLRQPRLVVLDVDQ